VASVREEEPAPKVIRVESEGGEEPAPRRRGWWSRG